MRLIFRLFQEGDQASGPMGVKGIVNWLNARGHRTRKGARWGVGPLHDLLSNPLYAGQMRFNRFEARTGRKKTEAELVTADAPAIIEPRVFERVQSLLHERNPRVTPPRVVTGPILLTGLTFCATCGGAMTLRTGTSKSGKVHRYYSCATAARLGKTACKGRSVPMDHLDTIVTQTMAAQIIHPDRVAAILAALSGKRAEDAAAVDERIDRLEQDAREVEERLSRLYRMVEDGVAELDDLLKERIASLKAERGHRRGRSFRSAARSSNASPRPCARN